MPEVGRKRHAAAARACGSTPPLAWMLHVRVDGGTNPLEPLPKDTEGQRMSTRHDETKSQTGALGLGLVLLLTIGAAACEQRKDTQVVDTPNGRTEQSTETVQVDKDSLKGAADQAGAAAGRAADQAGDAAHRAADKLGAAASDAKGNLSDAGLTAKVKTRLGTDNRVHASHIDVDTKDKVVTLNGSVASDAERQAAIEIARGTDGVSDVVDHLTVGSGQ